MAQQDLVTQYFDASDFDADGIAALHADSWRRHYRGAYLDTYLDGDVVADRQEVWRRRLAEPSTNQLTVIARRDDELIGFAHTAQSRGGDLKCVGLPQTIRQVANLVAMGDLMEFHDYLPQAMQAFHGQPADAAA